MKYEELINEILANFSEKEKREFQEYINFYSLRASDLNKISKSEKKENQFNIYMKEIAYFLNKNSISANKKAQLKEFRDNFLYTKYREISNKELLALAESEYREFSKEELEEN